MPNDILGITVIDESREQSRLTGLFPTAMSKNTHCYRL